MTTVRSPSPSPIARAAEELRQAADKAHRCRRAERGPVVVVDAIAQTGVADLIQPLELIERTRAAIRHQQAVEGDGQSRLTERLHRTRFAEDTCSSGDQHVLSAVRVHRVRDEAVHRRRRAAVETIGQDGVDHGAFKDAVQRSNRAYRAGRRRLTRLRCARRGSMPGILTMVARAGGATAPAVRADARTTASATSSIDGSAEGAADGTGSRRRADPHQAADLQDGG